MAQISRTFYRCVEDKLFWWHWQPKCIMLLTKKDKKKRGKTYVTLIVVGGRPTTFHLCPACLAEDERIKTKSKAVYVHRHVYPQRKPSLAAPVTPVPDAPQFRELQPVFTKNPVTQQIVRRDEAY